MKTMRVSLIRGALFALHAAGVLGDGTGFIGYGKTLYHPTCAFACRGVVKGCRLLCTPTDGTTNHGTAHAPVATPPDCFVQDTAFLRTMALCIDTYCPISDNPPLSLIEDYWASHLGTGTLGDYKWVPATSYQDALAAAREDERNHPGNFTGDDHSEHGGDNGFMSATGPNVSSPLPIIKASTPLNVTSFIAPKDWQKQYNGMLDFETNEKGHSTYSIVIMVVALFLPVPLSLLRFVHGVTKSRQWTSFQSAMIYPAVWGKRHRVPAAGGGMMPTRGQALYIALISLLNLVLLVAPYVYHHPQATFASLGAQKLSIIGNRAGCMAMGNVVALFLFAARNNVLLYVTDWSYSTYLLLHRWLGYWAVFHTLLHSVMLLAYYDIYGNYKAELVRQYWIWGIVGTVAAVALLLTSLPIMRQKLYELFLASHVVLSLLFIIGYYYHIWFLYEYKWGYEIWIFIAGGIWGVDRLARLVRMALRGNRTATVTSIQDTDGEYLRIDVEGVLLHDGGVAYLCFPTLGWRFWETHPFSVAFSSDYDVGARRSPASESKDVVVTDKADELGGSGTQSPKSSTVVPISGTGAPTTFFSRVRAGLTSQLAARVAATGSIRLRVFIDGPYPHSGAVTQLSHCSGIVYIAGGVGITALLPYLRQTRPSQPSWLFWAVRKGGLAAAVEPALAALPANVEVETTVGQRLDIDGILESRLTRADSPCGDGPLGIVVCGPPGMADHVRYKAVQLTRNGSAKRPYVLVDEAFGW